MCLRFADMERKLGEIDRAREIYTYCSQICDPRLTQEFWARWTDFEVAHGNEDTMKELLRIKRSMQAKYNTQVRVVLVVVLYCIAVGGHHHGIVGRESVCVCVGDIMWVCGLWVKERERESWFVS